MEEMNVSDTIDVVESSISAKEKCLYESKEMFKIRVICPRKGLSRNNLRIHIKDIHFKGTSQRETLYSTIRKRQEFIKSL